MILRVNNHIQYKSHVETQIKDHYLDSLIDFATM